MADTANDLRDLAADLRAAGNGQLAKDMLKEIREVAKAITPDTRRRALATLPRRGGLARLVARAPQRVSARAGKTTASVTLSLSGKRKGPGATQADAGVVRHPTFGHRPFVAQQVPPGFFTDTAQASAPAVAQAVADVVDRTARRAGFR